MTVWGRPIIYGVTILENAPHREKAIDFLDFLLANGAAYWEQSGMMAMQLPQISAQDLSLVPEKLLRHFLKKGQTQSLVTIV